MGYRVQSAFEPISQKLFGNFGCTTAPERFNFYDVQTEFYLSAK